MSVLIEYPQLNGHRFSHSSIEISWHGIPLRGVKTLNFDDSLEPGEVYGTAPQIIGRTRGKQKATASIELYRLEWEVVRKTLGVAGRGYGETASDIIVTYLELGVEPLVDTILAARVTKAGQGSSDNADALLVKLDLMPMRIYWNGDAIAQAINVGL